jgi:hypothetical protein
MQQIQQLTDHYFKNLLTSILTLADAAKLQEKFKLKKNYNWTDCVESILKDSA